MMSFLKDSIDLFEKTRQSHMGRHQYVHHAGQRDGQSTSGAHLWAMAEKARLTHSQNMIGAEHRLLQMAAQDLATLLPSGTNVVELGPGTTTAFQGKTLPILQAMKSKTYIPVDLSMAFLQGISHLNNLPPETKVKPDYDDFFEGDYTYTESPALVCSFGSTISNIITPMSPTPPLAALTKNLRTLANATQKGWFLVAFDTDQNGEKIKDYFAAHALFQLNIFDRMAVELPVSPDFDPLAFRYEPVWIAASGQLAHTAVVGKDMSFTLGSKSITLAKGDRLHLKNSYKFTQTLFDAAARAAHLTPMKIWADDSPTRVYLLHKEDTMMDTLRDKIGLLTRNPNRTSRAG